MLFSLMNHFSADSSSSFNGEQLTVRNNNVQINNSGSKLSPKDIIEKYLNSLNTANTRTSYKKSIELFFEYIVGDRELTFQDFVVDPSETVEYVQYLKGLLDDGEIKASTFNKRIQGVRKFYDWLKINTTSNKYNLKLLEVNPFYAVKQISESDSVGSEPLTDEDIINMLENPYGSYPHLKERNKLILELGIITGIRRTALITATIEDIKEKDGVHYMEVVDKNKKTVKIQIDEIYERLVEWYNEDKKLRKGKNISPIFNITPREANRIISAWVAQLGINKKVSFHSFRTTTAVKIYENNDSNIYKAQMALGHNNASITKRYLDKANAINTSGNNLISDIYNTDPLYRKLMSMEKNQIISLIMGADEEVRKELLKYLD